MTGNVKDLGRTLAVGLGLLISVWKLLAVIALVFIVAVGCIIWFDGRTLGDASYLAAITFLTIGYGDITPKSAPAKAMCVLLGFAGVVFTGVVVAATIKALERA